METKENEIINGIIDEMHLSKLFIVVLTIGSIIAFGCVIFFIVALVSAIFNLIIK